MKRLLIIGFSLILSFAIGTSIGYAEDIGKQGQKADVKLTNEQKVELESLYNNLFKTKKLLIEKYQEYGVISNEKAQKKLQHLDKISEKIKENGYVPKWDHHHKKDKLHKSE